MKRLTITMSLFLAALAGCVGPDYAPETGGVRPHYGKSAPPPSVPGVEGPYGTKVPMTAPYAYAPPGSQQAALDMMSKNIPLSAVQMNQMGMPTPGPGGSMMPNSMAPGGMVLSPPGVPGMPGMSPPGGMPYGPGGPGMPPMMPPGAGGFGAGPGGPGMPGMPGMPPGGPGMPMMQPGGPGMPPLPGMPGMPPMGGNPNPRTSFASAPENGLMTADLRSGAPGGLTQAFLPGGPGNVAPAQASGPNGGVVPAQFAASSPVGSMFPAQRTQVYFGSPVRMKIYWFTQGADGKPNYSTTPLETPGRYNFAQGAIYRLKLTNIPGRPALELYPTLEVVPTSPRTNEFLAHNSVPVDFTEEDFKQVVDRNYIVKVIYLPDPANQDGAGAGPGEISSTQLEPGQDPIQEALRRGSILLVLRIGNIDQGVQHSPPMTAPSPGGPPMMMKPPGMGVQPFLQVPYNAMPLTPGTILPPPGFGPNQPPPGFGPNNLPPNNLPPNIAPPNFAPKDIEPKKGPDNGLDLPPLPPPNPKANPNLPLPGLPLPPPGLQPKAGEEIKLPLPGVVPVPPPGAKPSEDIKAPGNEKPIAPPIPLPGTDNSPKSPPVIPASKEVAPKTPASPQVPPVVLPELPGLVDPLSPDQPPVPTIPMPTDRK